jgi:hypothetical protein
MPVVGGVTTELNRNVNSAVTFSPDAQRLAFLRNNAETKQSSIINADAADGRNERTLATRQWPQNFSRRVCHGHPMEKQLPSAQPREMADVTICSRYLSRMGTLGE